MAGSFVADVLLGETNEVCVCLHAQPQAGPEHAPAPLRSHTHAITLHNLQHSLLSCVMRWTPRQQYCVHPPLVAGRA
jgi:hypothetical protein